MGDLTRFLDESRTILLAVAILIGTSIVAHFAAKLIRNMITSNGRQLPRGSIAENIVRGLVWAIGLSIILAYCFDVDVHGLIAALGVGGIALSLGLQNTISNIIGGIQISWLGIIEPGDHVAIDSTEGVIENVNWRQTTLRGFDGIIHVIPNSMINANNVDKYEPNNIVSTPLCFANQSRNLDATITEMERLAKDAVSKVAKLERDPWILLTDIGEYGTHAKLRFVLKDTKHVEEARDAAVRAVAHYTQQSLETPSESADTSVATRDGAAQDEGVGESADS